MRLGSFLTLMVALLIVGPVQADPASAPSARDWQIAILNAELEQASGLLARTRVGGRYDLTDLRTTGLLFHSPVDADQVTFGYRIQGTADEGTQWVELCRTAEAHLRLCEEPATAPSAIPPAPFSIPPPPPIPAKPRRMVLVPQNVEMPAPYDPPSAEEAAIQEQHDLYDLVREAKGPGDARLLDLQRAVLRVAIVGAELEGAFPDDWGGLLKTLQLAPESYTALIEAGEQDHDSTISVRLYVERELHWLRIELLPEDSPDAYRYYLHHDPEAASWEDRYMVVPWEEVAPSSLAEFRWLVDASMPAAPDARP